MIIGLNRSSRQISGYFFDRSASVKSIVCIGVAGLPLRLPMLKRVSMTAYSAGSEEKKDINCRNALLRSSFIERVEN